MEANFAVPIWADLPVSADPPVSALRRPKRALGCAPRFAGFYLNVSATVDTLAMLCFIQALRGLSRMASAPEQSVFAVWGAVIPFYRPGAGVPYRMHSEVMGCPGQALQARLHLPRQST